MPWSSHTLPLSFPRCQLIIRMNLSASGFVYTEGQKNSLYVAVNGGSLSIENHLDGEGYACILPIAKLKMQRIKEGVQEIVLTSGTATCHAEENPSEKHVVVLLYSRRATTRGDRSETLVFAGWGDTEMLKRK